MKEFDSLTDYEIIEIQNFNRLEVSEEIICKRFEITEEVFRQAVAERRMYKKTQGLINYDKVKEMLLANKSNKEIAEAFGITDNYVSYINSLRFKIKRKRSHEKMTKKNWKEAVDLYNYGFSARWIANIYGVSTNYIYKIKDKLSNE